jgi:hypothetical protein
MPSTQAFIFNGEIALVFLAAGLINQNISKCLILLTTEDCNDAVQESMLADNVIEAEEAEKQ